MAISQINANAPGITTQKTGFAALGQGDFLKLMTAQLQQQDPFAPVDNKEMLAQMAQFSALAAGKPQQPNPSPDFNKEKTHVFLHFTQRPQERPDRSGHHRP
jgi:flagellar hook assembly protein FlgD